MCNDVALTKGVRRVNVKADLETAGLVMEVDVEADSEFVAEAQIREALGLAIRSSGGAHIGLLSEGDEARARVERNAWHGLRTPQWQQRRTEVLEVS